MKKMQFNKRELLKIYVAMTSACDLALKLNSTVSDEFKEIMNKIKEELIKD